MDSEIRSRFTGLAMVVAATACWSTSGILINLIVRNSGITAVGLAFWRDLGTFLVLLVGLAIVRRDLLRVNRRDLPWLAAMGAASIGVFHILWNISVTTLGASVSTVIQCNAPVFVTVLAWLIWREPLTRRKIAAIVLAVVGTIFIARLDNLGTVDITLLGVLIALGSALMYGSFSLFGKKLSGSYSSWTILVYVFGVASIVLFPFQFGSSSPFQASTQVVGYYLALVLVTTISGFGLYTAALRRLQASVAAITANAEVPFAAILAYLLLGERLDGLQVLGATLIIVAVVLISIPRQTLQQLTRRLSGQAAIAKSPAQPDQPA